MARRRHRCRFGGRVRGRTCDARRRQGARRGGERSSIGDPAGAGASGHRQRRNQSRCFEAVDRHASLGHGQGARKQRTQPRGATSDVRSRRTSARRHARSASRAAQRACPPRNRRRKKCRSGAAAGRSLEAQGGRRGGRCLARARPAAAVAALLRDTGARALCRDPRAGRQAVRAARLGGERPFGPRPRRHRNRSRREPAGDRRMGRPRRRAPALRRSAPRRQPRRSRARGAALGRTRAWKRAELGGAAVAGRRSLALSPSPA